MPRCPRLSQRNFKLAIVFFFIFCCLSYNWPPFDQDTSLNSFSNTTRIYDKVIWTNNILNEVRNNLHYEEFSASVAYPDLTGHSIPWFSHPQIPRKINKTEYESTRRLMQYLEGIFTANNITYVLAYGTLLGSYISHDILPWDDDLDLLVKLSDKEKLLGLFKSGSKYPYIKAMVNTNAYFRAHILKVYDIRSSHAGKYPWNWPFADVTFYDENDNSVWAADNHFIVRRSSFYPLHRRPFSGMWLPSPKDPRFLLRMNYKQFKCKSYNYDHKNEMSKSYWNNVFPSFIPTVDCSSVVGYYPFVHRTVHNGGVNKTLKIGEFDIYTVYVDELQTGRSAQSLNLIWPHFNAL